MTKWNDGARWRALTAVALLLFTGAVLGIIVDRNLLSPRELDASPLTAEALGARLGLSAEEEAQLRVLLDSLHAELMTAAELSPDSLRIMVRLAHRRIEAVLPPHTRADFRAWIHEHHQQLRRLHGRPVDHGSDR
jgi:hypothetical protein